MTDALRVGRIVHYSDPREGCVVAFVTSVDLGHVTLAVLPPGAPNVQALADVPYSATPQHVGTWHWPEGTREHEAVSLTRQCPGCPCGWNGPHALTEDGLPELPT